MTPSSEMAVRLIPITSVIIKANASNATISAAPRSSGDGFIILSQFIMWFLSIVSNPGCRDLRSAIPQAYRCRKLHLAVLRVGGGNAARHGGHSHIDFTARPVRVAESYATNILGNRQNPAR